VHLRDILQPDMVLASLDAGSKEDALAAVAGLVTLHPRVPSSADVVLTALLSRERLGSTGVGEGVAIPHAKLSGLRDLVGCFARVPSGVSFDAIDRKPVHLLFVLLVPENSAGAHLKALARVSRLLRSPELRTELLGSDQPSVLYERLVGEDDKH